MDCAGTEADQEMAFDFKLEGGSLNPEPQTLYPQPQTLNPKP